MVINHRRGNRTVRGLLLAALVVGGLAVTAAPAQAAPHVPNCTDDTIMRTKNGMTTYTPGGPDRSNCELRLGMHNWSVVVLQIALNDCFFKNPNALVVDGIYGEKTMNSVKFLQASVGYTASGEYDHGTGIRMRWGYRSPGSAGNPKPDACLFYTP